jgi:hypothetical protein
MIRMTGRTDVKAGWAMVVCLLLAPPGTLAEDDRLVPGAQPLAEGGLGLIERLASECGRVLGSSAEAPEAVRYSMESCDVVVDSLRGVLHVERFSDAGGWAELRLDSAEVAARQSADLSVLVGLGFDEVEFGSVRTLELAVRDRDEGTGAVGGPRYLGTKTVVARELSGVPVLGNRVVVSRDAEGAIIRITAAWPELDAGMSVLESSTVGWTGTEASSLTNSTIQEVRPVLILREPRGGTVTDAWLCTEVTRLIDAEEGERPSTFYVLDGQIFDPTSGG